MEVSFVLMSVAMLISSFLVIHGEDDFSGNFELEEMTPDESIPNRVFVHNTFRLPSMDPFRAAFDDALQSKQSLANHMQLVEPAMDSLMRSNKNVINSLHRLENKFDRIWNTIGFDRGDQTHGTRDVINKLNSIHQYIVGSGENGFREKNPDSTAKVQMHLIKKLAAAVGSTNRNLQNVAVSFDQVMGTNKHSMQLLERVAELVQDIDERTIRIQHVSPRRLQASNFDINENEVTGLSRNHPEPKQIKYGLNENEPAVHYRDQQVLTPRQLQSQYTASNQGLNGNEVTDHSKNLPNTQTNYDLNEITGRSRDLSTTTKLTKTQSNYDWNENEITGSSRNQFGSPRQFQDIVSNHGLNENEVADRSINRPIATKAKYDSDESGLTSHRNDQQFLTPHQLQSQYTASTRGLNENEVAGRSRNFPKTQTNYDSNENEIIGSSRNQFGPPNQLQDTVSIHGFPETQMSDLGENGIYGRSRGIPTTKTTTTLTNYVVNKNEIAGNSRNIPIQTVSTITTKTHSNYDLDNKEITGSSKDQQISPSQFQLQGAASNSNENEITGRSRDPFIATKAQTLKDIKTEEIRKVGVSERTQEDLKKDENGVFLEPKKYNCHDLKIRQSGIYKFTSHDDSPNTAGRSFNKRYCDFETDGVAWTVIQRRYAVNNKENFNRTWLDYKLGFGDLDKEFWFGNDFIHKLTFDEDVELRIILVDKNGKKDWAEYSLFKMKSERYNYKLMIGGYRGSASDSLIYHNNQHFSTYDRYEISNKDIKSCASSIGNGWWFKDCNKGVLGNWLGSISTKMMIRPRRL